ncbi:type VII secretion target [Pseudonocardia sp.]|jgi:hypothetical protein|uniref:type VII secretion target n=1 Tax=Pseudonocardia sp. TaxID=60912 RepID=UPI00263078E4|nr:type VII secretion target [Pseudonocardia sp.]MCW2721224.1 hypothetical protein [Pseudonocardia sp.]MDT7613305.1 hypothetical protein [Pseudonocardiales bacterium]
MNDGFRVDDAAIAAHIGTVDAMASRVQVAAAAGRPLDVDAYGLVGQLFAGAAAEAAATGSAAVGDLARQATALVEGLRTSRAAYLDADARNGAVLASTRPPSGQR